MMSSSEVGGGFLPHDYDEEAAEGSTKYNLLIIAIDESVQHKMVLMFQ